MTDSPPPGRRGWIEALVATALRWNDRLGRPVGALDSPPSDRPPVDSAPTGPRRRFRSAAAASPETGSHRI